MNDTAKKLTPRQRETREVSRIATEMQKLYNDLSELTANPSEYGPEHASIYNDARTNIGQISAAIHKLRDFQKSLPESTPAPEKLEPETEPETEV